MSIINFDPKYLRTGKTEWAEIFLGTSLSRSIVSKNIFKGPVGLGPRPKQQHFYPIFYFDPSSTQNTKPFQKRFASLAAQAIFRQPIFIIFD